MLNPEVPVVSSFEGVHTRSTALLPLEMSPQQVEFKNQLGTGSFGEVYRAVVIDGRYKGQEVAVKTLLTQDKVIRYVW